MQQFVLNPCSSIFSLRGSASDAEKAEAKKRRIEFRKKRKEERQQKRAQKDEERKKMRNAEFFADKMKELLKVEQDSEIEETKALMESLPPKAYSLLILPLSFATTEHLSNRNSSLVASCCRNSKSSNNSRGLEANTFSRSKGPIPSTLPFPRISSPQVPPLANMSGSLFSFTTFGCRRYRGLKE